MMDGWSGGSSSQVSRQNMLMCSDSEPLNNRYCMLLMG